MKLMKTMLALGTFALMSSLPFMTVQAAQGVKCDDQKQICRDRSGPSVEQTRQRYGDQAAQRLQKRMSRDEGGGRQDGGQGGGRQGGGGQQQSGDVFSPIGGVRCVRSEQTCYHYNQPSYQFTQQYFGPGAANRLNR
ncbi:MAG: hypothetical protein KDJ34_01920 [Candidatus Competibacteraceae bacterium]|nr:hypothetical protein [Candidatus Competibacteraceae bacterium]